MKFTHCSSSTNKYNTIQYNTIQYNTIQALSLVLIFSFLFIGCKKSSTQYQEAPANHHLSLQGKKKSQSYTKRALGYIAAAMVLLGNSIHAEETLKIDSDPQELLGRRKAFDYKKINIIQDKEKKINQPIYSIKKNAKTYCFVDPKRILMKKIEAEEGKKKKVWSEEINKIQIYYINQQQGKLWDEIWKLATELKEYKEGIEDEDEEIVFKKEELKTKIKQALEKKEYNLLTKKNKNEEITDEDIQTIRDTIVTTYGKYLTKEVLIKMTKDIKKYMIKLFNCKDIAEDNPLITTATENEQTRYEGSEQDLKKNKAEKNEIIININRLNSNRHKDRTYIAQDLNNTTEYCTAKAEDIESFIDKNEDRTYIILYHEMIHWVHNKCIKNYGYHKKLRTTTQLMTNNDNAQFLEEMVKISKNFLKFLDSSNEKKSDNYELKKREESSTQQLNPIWKRAFETFNNLEEISTVMKGKFTEWSETVTKDRPLRFPYEGIEGIMIKKELLQEMLEEAGMQPRYIETILQDEYKYKTDCELRVKKREQNEKIELDNFNNMFKNDKKKVKKPPLRFVDRKQKKNKTNTSTNIII